MPLTARGRQRTVAEQIDDEEDWDPNEWEWEPSLCQAKKRRCFGPNDPLSARSSAIEVTGSPEPPGFGTVPKAESTSTNPKFANLPVYNTQKKLEARPEHVCVVEGCGASLLGLKRYFTRLRICEAHLGAPAIVVDGVISRFCQQCGRFQPLHEFTGKKKSCTERLEKVNARHREKAQQKQRRPDGRLPQPGPLPEWQEPPVAVLAADSAAAVLAAPALAGPLAVPGAPLVAAVTGSAVTTGAASGTNEKRPSVGTDTSTAARTRGPPAATAVMAVQSSGLTSLSSLPEAAAAVAAAAVSGGTPPMPPATAADELPPVLSTGAATESQAEGTAGSPSRVAADLRRSPTPVSSDAVQDGVCTGDASPKPPLRIVNTAGAGLVWYSLRRHPQPAAAAAAAVSPGSVPLYERASVNSAVASAVAAIPTVPRLPRSAFWNLITTAMHSGGADEGGADGDAAAAVPPPPDEVRKAICAAGEDLFLPSRVQLLATEPSQAPKGTKRPAGCDGPPPMAQRPAPSAGSEQQSTAQASPLLPAVSSDSSANVGGAAISGLSGDVTSAGVGNGAYNVTESDTPVHSTPSAATPSTSSVSGGTPPVPASSPQLAATLPQLPSTSDGCQMPYGAAAATATMSGAPLGSSPVVCSGAASAIPASPASQSYQSHSGTAAVTSGGALAPEPQVSSGGMAARGSVMARVNSVMSELRPLLAQVQHLAGSVTGGTGSAAAAGSTRAAATTSTPGASAAAGGGRAAQGAGGGGGLFEARAALAAAAGGGGGAGGMQPVSSGLQDVLGASSELMQRASDLDSLLRARGPAPLQAEVAAAQPQRSQPAAQALPPQPHPYDTYYAYSSLAQQPAQLQQQQQQHPSAGLGPATAPTMPTAPARYYTKAPPAPASTYQLTVCGSVPQPHGGSIHHTTTTTAIVHPSTQFVQPQHTPHHPPHYAPQYPPQYLQPSPAAPQYALTHPPSLGPTELYAVQHHPPQQPQQYHTQLALQQPSEAMPPQPTHVYSQTAPGVTIQRVISARSLFHRPAPSTVHGHIAGAPTVPVPYPAQWNVYPNSQPRYPYAPLPAAVVSAAVPYDGSPYVAGYPPDGPSGGFPAGSAAAVAGPQPQPVSPAFSMPAAAAHTPVAASDIGPATATAQPLPLPPLAPYSNAPPVYGTQYQQQNGVYDFLLKPDPAQANNNNDDDDDDNGLLAMLLEQLSDDPAPGTVIAADGAAPAPAAQPQLQPGSHMEGVAAWPSLEALQQQWQNERQVGGAIAGAMQQGVEMHRGTLAAAPYTALTGGAGGGWPHGAAGGAAAGDAVMMDVERVTVKAMNMQPGDLPANLRNGLGKWLHTAGAEPLQATLRPGCLQLIIDVQRPASAAARSGDLASLLIPAHEPEQAAADVFRILGQRLRDTFVQVGDRVLQIRVGENPVVTSWEEAAADGGLAGAKMPCLRGCSHVAVCAGSEAFLELYGIHLAQPRTAVFARLRGRDLPASLAEDVDANDTSRSRRMRMCVALPAHAAGLLAVEVGVGHLLGDWWPLVVLPAGQEGAAKEVERLAGPTSGAAVAEGNGGAAAEAEERQQAAARAESRSFITDLGRVLDVYSAATAAAAAEAAAAAAAAANADAFAETSRADGSLAVSLGPERIPSTTGSASPNSPSSALCGVGGGSTTATSHAGTWNYTDAGGTTLASSAMESSTRGSTGMSSVPAHATGSATLPRPIVVGEAAARHVAATGAADPAAAAAVAAARLGGGSVRPEGSITVIAAPSSGTMRRATAKAARLLRFAVTKGCPHLTALLLSVAERLVALSPSSTQPATSTAAGGSAAVPGSGRVTAGTAPAATRATASDVAAVLSAAGVDPQALLLLAVLSGSTATVDCLAAFACGVMRWPLRLDLPQGPAGMSLLHLAAVMADGGLMARHLIATQPWAAWSWLALPWSPPGLTGAAPAPPSAPSPGSMQAVANSAAGVQVGCGASGAAEGPVAEQQQRRRLQLTPGSLSLLLGQEQTLESAVSRLVLQDEDLVAVQVEVVEEDEQGHGEEGEGNDKGGKFGRGGDGAREAAAASSASTAAGDEVLDAALADVVGAWGRLSTALLTSLCQQLEAQRI